MFTNDTTSYKKRLAHNFRHWFLNFPGSDLTWKLIWFPAGAPTSRGDHAFSLESPKRVPWTRFATKNEKNESHKKKQAEGSLIRTPFSNIIRGNLPGIVIFGMEFFLKIKWLYKSKRTHNIPLFRMTHGVTPKCFRNSETCWLGDLGFVPGVCWKILRDGQSIFK